MTILVITVIGTVVGTIIALEALAWMPHLSWRLLRKTIDRLAEGLPEDVALRWGEEIEADFQTYGSRPIGGLVYAAGVRLRGGRQLLAELAVEPEDESDSVAPEIDYAIPAHAEVPIAKSAPAVVAASLPPLHLRLSRRIRENPREAVAVSAISLGLSLCMAVVLEILEERERR